MFLQSASIIIAIAALIWAAAAAFYSWRTYRLLKNGIESSHHKGLMFYEGSLKEDLDNLGQELGAVKRFLHTLKQIFERQYNDRDSLLKDVNTGLRHNSDLIQDLALHARETEEKLKEFRSGYRWSAISHAFAPVIECLDHLDDQMRAATNDSSRQSFHRLQVLFMQAIHGAGLHETGDDLLNRPLEDVADICRSVSTVPTEVVDRDKCVAQVIRRGFYCNPTPTTRSVVRHAQVTVYKATSSPSPSPTATGISAPASMSVGAEPAESRHE